MHGGAPPWRVRRGRGSAGEEGGARPEPRGCARGPGEGNGRPGPGAAEKDRGGRAGFAGPECGGRGPGRSRSPGTREGGRSPASVRGAMGDGRRRRMLRGSTIAVRRIVRNCYKCRPGKHLRMFARAARGTKWDLAETSGGRSSGAAGAEEERQRRHREVWGGARCAGHAGEGKPRRANTRRRAPQSPPGAMNPSPYGRLRIPCERKCVRDAGPSGARPWRGGMGRSGGTSIGTMRYAESARGSTRLETVVSFPGAPAARPREGPGRTGGIVRTGPSRGHAQTRSKPLTFP